MVADTRLSAVNLATGDRLASPIGMARPTLDRPGALRPLPDELRPFPAGTGAADLPPKRPMPGAGFDRLAALGRIRPFPIILNLPVPRSQTTVPIAPFGNISPDTVYEDPADPARHYALPLFNLAVQTVDGKSRLRVAFEKAQPSDPASLQWLLTVRFGPALRSPDFLPLSYNPAVLLRFTPPVAGATPKELPCLLEQEDPATWKATLLRNGLTERDEAVNALKNPEYQAHFVVRCAFDAAVPDSVSDTGEQLYRKGSYSVDIPLDRDPFFIDPTAHPYVYAEVQDASTRVFGLKLHQVEFQGRFHHFYQDEASPYIFYYLPDCYKVSRRPTPPFTPQMLAKFRSEDGSLEKMRVSLEYVATPIVNTLRLNDAVAALSPHLPAPMPPGVTGPVFQPLVVDAPNQLTLNLALPRQSETGSLQQARAGVVTKLSEDFQDELAGLSMADFQNIFDALFGKSAVIFKGEVLLAPSGERPGETVPFVARLNDLSGRVLEEFETPSPDGPVDVKLRNGIESPLTVRSIPVQLMAGRGLFPAHIENLSKAGSAAGFPVSLAPGEELNLKVVPDQGLPVGIVPGQIFVPDAIFGLDDIGVEPDPEAIWKAIVDTSVPAEYHREIKVTAFAEWFAPDTDLIAIAIDFSNGDAVLLKREALEATAHVRVPVSDLVLRKVQESTYGYVMQLIYKTRPRVRLDKTDTLDLLIPELPA